MALKKQAKKPTKAQPKKKPSGSSRIKQIGGTHWVLKSQNDVRKYKGFSSKADAEQFAAATPVEKGVKISAEKARPASAKKSANRCPTPKIKKPYTPPTALVIGLDQLPPSGKDPKIRSFAAGREKYKKK